MQDHQLPPSAVIMQMLFGRFVSQAIGTAAKLKLADHLSSGPRTFEQLAKDANAHPPSVYRLLRALASLGVFAEQEHGRFANTPLSEALRDQPGSVRPMALFFNDASHLKAWTALDYSVTTGACGFEKAHGSSTWDYVSSHADVSEIFNNAMTSLSAQFAPAVAMGYDFSGIATLVDIGGGHGTLLGTILGRHPALRGVLFDLPHVVAGAPKQLASMGVTERCEVVGGDFFKQVPTGDAYVMKHIIHDWDDARSIEIMKTIHRAAKPGAKLLLVESVIKPGNTPDMGKILDLEMLVVTQGGRERTEAEYRALFEAAGFKLERLVPTMAPVTVLEAIRI